MAQTGERIRRACTAPLPEDMYDPEASASAIRCTRPEGHGGFHSATVNIPRTLTWGPSQLPASGRPSDG